MALIRKCSHNAMLREKSIFFSRVEKEFPFQILLSFQQIISYCFIAVAEDGSLNIAGNHIFFPPPTSAGLGKTGKSRTWARTGPAEWAHTAGKTGTARPQIRSQGSYEGDVAERKPATGVSGSVQITNASFSEVAKKHWPSARGLGAQDSTYQHPVPWSCWPGAFYFPQRGCLTFLIFFLVCLSNLS